MTNEFQQEIEEERSTLRQDIKKTGGNCAKILLILAISTYGIEFAVIFIIKLINIILSIITKGNFNIISHFSKDAENFLVGYLPCIIGDIIAIIIAMNTTKIKIKQEIFSKNRSTKLFVLLGTASSIGVGMISNTIYSLYAIILNELKITIPTPDFTFPSQTVYLILFLTYVCLVGPILEEIIFRGFILKSMQRYGNLTAIIVSSILFSMFHLNLVQFINPILMGIILAFIATKSKSIVPSIIVHVFNNTINFAITGISLLNMPIVDVLVGVIYFLIGIAALLLFVNMYKEDFMETAIEDTMVLKILEKVKASFSGGWAIGYIVFYGLFIVGTTLITNITKIK
ncbi:Abortive infection protein [Clostridium sp. DL-VIII]|nr:Abortive infection protein [Clostridium sp. DL-VIII]